MSTQESLLNNHTKSYQDFLDSLPEIVYEIRVFKPNLNKVDKDFVLSAINTLRNTAEEDLDKIIAQISSGLIQFFDGTFLFANKHAFKSLGYSKKQLGDIKLSEILAPEFLEKSLFDTFRIIIQLYQKNSEYEILKSNGDRITISENSELIQNSFPFVIRGILRDITVQRQAENDLKEMNTRYIRLFENSNDAVIIHDLQGNIIDVNEKACELLSDSKDELLSSTLSKFHADTEIQLIENRIRTTKREGSARFETVFVGKNGERLFVDVSSRLIDSEKGLVQGIVRDITDFKLQENALLEDTAKLDSILRTLPDIIYRLDSHGKITFVSDVIRNYGYDPYDLLGRDILDIVHPDDRSNAIYRLNERRTKKRGTESFEIRLISKSKQDIPLEVHAGYIEPTIQVNAEGLYMKDLIKEKRFIGTQGIARDITYRKTIEASLERSVEQFKSLIENSPDIIMQYNSNIQVIYASPSLEYITGFLVEDFEGKTHKELFSDSKICDYFDTVITTVLETRLALLESFEVDTPKGKLSFDWRLIPLFEKTGEVKTVLSIARDVTEHRNAEKSLKESEERFREVFENMSSGVAIYEATENGEDFTFKDFNKSAEIIDSTPRDKLIGKNVTAVFPGIKDLGLLEVMQNVNKTGKSQLLPVSKYKDERISGWRENFVSKLPSGEIVVIYQDITKKKQSEEEREILITDLQNALNEVNRLRGLIPICSHCKKIRNDTGSWEQLESYITEHSEAVFSHGICPNCLDEHYPDYAD